MIIRESINSINLWKAHPLSKLNLHHTTDLFSMNPKPFRDELVSSWIYRLAKENFLSYVKFLRKFAEIDFDIIKKSSNKQYWKFDLDKNLPDELLNALSLKTGLSIEQIIDLTLKEWEDNLFELFIARKGTRSSKKLGGLRFCPLCLKEDEIPYYRKFWRLKIVTFCEKHQIYLYDRCTNPECEKPINIRLMKYEDSIKICPYCGEDLSKSEIVRIPQHDPYVEIQNNMKLILKKGICTKSDETKILSQDFFEAVYFLSRFIIKYFPFNESEYKDHPLIISGVLDRERSYLSQRDYVFENIPISQLAITIAFKFLIEDADRLKNFISYFQTEYNYETYRDCPKILFDLRDSKGTNLEITVRRIKNAINQIRQKGLKITYDRVAKEAKCANNFHLSHPHLRELVDSEKAREDSNTDLIGARRKRKASNEIEIKPQEVIEAIQKLKNQNKRVTYKAIGKIINENYWNLKERPEIVEIIRPHLSQSTKKKYFFTPDDIHNTINIIRSKGLQISINEVCRKLNCHKTFFRNNPDLKNIILKAKKEDQQKIVSLIPKKGNFQELSPKAKQFEPIFIRYKESMEELGKNWRVTKTDVLAKKLEIPPNILMEIKLKYCPFTRKAMRNQKESEYRKKNKKEIIKNFELSEEAEEYEQDFIEYIKEMKDKGKSWKSANNRFLVHKLNIPLEPLKELKRKYLDFK